MGLFKRLFTRSDINFAKQAKRLVGTAKMFAVTSYKPFADQYSIIKTVSLDQWDFILTIAGVFVAVSQLNHENLPEEKKNNILDLVTEQVVEWDADGLNACEDCRQFVGRTYDALTNESEYKRNPEYLFCDSLGSWVVWNIFGHAPSSNEQRQLIRVLGAMLIHPFIDWWKNA